MLETYRVEWQVTHLNLHAHIFNYVYTSHSVSILKKLRNPRYAPIPLLFSFAFLNCLVAASWSPLRLPATRRVSCTWQAKLQMSNVFQKHQVSFCPYLIWCTQGQKSERIWSLRWANTVLVSPDKPWNITSSSECQPTWFSSLATRQKWFVTKSFCYGLFSGRLATF